MKKMSFTSRDLGRAAEIYNTMLADKDCSIFLVIAGSTSAGGCMDLYADLVRNNMVDGIVATGATIVDMDFFEALGHKHYQALEIPTTTRCARSTSIVSTTPISMKRSCRRPITRSARSPTAWSRALFLARVHPRDGQVADDERQEGEQPRQARLRA
jgi:hypothetical protein